VSGTVADAAPRPLLGGPEWRLISLHALREMWPLLPALVLLIVFFAVPLVLIAPESLDWSGKPVFGTYVKVLGDSYYWSVLGRSVWLSLLSTVICVILAYPLAYYLVRICGSGMRRLVFILIIAPLFTSAVIRSMAWLIILGRRGLVNDGLTSLGLVEAPLRLLYNDFAVVLGLLYILLPFMVLSIAAVLESIDVTLEQAARDLGETAFGAFRRVTLPLSMPGILAGSFLVFALCVSSYVTPAILGGGRNKVIAMLIFEQFMRLFNWPLGAALSCILLAISLLVIWGYNRVLTRWIAAPARVVA
jgi:putative spermidine/putrescine transport system permease protein